MLCKTNVAYDRQFLRVMLILKGEIWGGAPDAAPVTATFSPVCKSARRDSPLRGVPSLDERILNRVPVNSISKNLHAPEEPLTPSKYVQDGPKAGSDSGLESQATALRRIVLR